VVNLPTRPDVQQPYLWLPAPDAVATVVLLVGGNGWLNLSEEGAVRSAAGNFLARSRALFMEQGMSVALPDAPSDRQKPPYLSGFRQTPEHVTDLRAVMADIRKRTGKPVLLVGTSRGTQSAAYVAIASRDAGGPDALVLTSTILEDRKSNAVPQMDLQSLRLPVLVVHHEQDGCALCRYADVPLLTAKLTAPYKVLSYQDGSSRGDPCEAFAYHGYNGIEPRVVQDIATWIKSNLPH
jgi:pimeloyl-ACP methyl ester carboxylesterase